MSSCLPLKAHKLEQRTLPVHVLLCVDMKRLLWQGIKKGYSSTEHWQNYLDLTTRKRQGETEFYDAIRHNLHHHPPVIIAVIKSEDVILMGHSTRVGETGN